MTAASATPVAATAVPPEQAIPTAAEVVVTASRSPQPLREVPDSISVTGPEEIRDNNARDLGEVVERAPGIEAVTHGGPGSASNLAVRGSRANQVLVMQDGRPIQQVSTGEADVSQVAAGAIDRVEVLRGPSSLLYGSSAIGGVVNVITPEPPSEFSGVIEGQGGTFGAITRRVRVGGPVAFSRWLFQQDGVQSDGYRPNSDFKGETFILKGEFDMRPRITVQGGASDTDVGTPGVKPSPLPFDPTDVNWLAFAYNPARRSPAETVFGNDEVASLIDRQRNSNRYVDTRVEMGGNDGNQLSLRHYTEFNSLAFRNGEYYPLFGGNPEITSSFLDTDIQGAEAQVTARPWLMDGGYVTVGGAWRKERFVKRDEKFDTVTGGSVEKEGIRARVETGAEFVEGSLKPLAPLAETTGRPWINGLTVVGGARHDSYSTFGDVLNPHAGVVLDLGPLVPAADRLALKGSYGTAFRSPSFNNLFWPDVGNPALKPERGHTGEAGIEGQVKGLGARIGGFVREVRDQIDWSPDSSGMWRPSNVGLVRTRGLEGEVSYNRGWVRIGGNVTVIDSRQRKMEILEYDTTTWAPVATEVRERFTAHVPRYTAGAFVGADLPTGTGASLALKGSGSRRMYMEDTFATFPKTRMVEKRLGSFAVMTARVSQTVTRALEIYAGVENLADKSYSANFGNVLGDGDYPAPPRTWFAGATARW